MPVNSRPPVGSPGWQEGREKGTSWLLIQRTVHLPQEMNVGETRISVLSYSFSDGLRLSKRQYIRVLIINTLHCQPHDKFVLMPSRTCDIILGESSSEVLFYTVRRIRPSFFRNRSLSAKEESNSNVTEPAWTLSFSNSLLFYC